LARHQILDAAACRIATVVVRRHLFSLRHSQMGDQVTERHVARNEQRGLGFGNGRFASRLVA
jgi:hypothetical protein